MKHGTNGAAVITLDAATQKIMGLQTAPLAPATLPRQVKGFGRVLDPAPLAALAGDLATALAANAASQAELRRLKTLATQQNASERAVQAAEAVAVRDQTQVEAVRLKLLTSWGPAIARRQDLSGFVQTLGAQSSALIEIDLPAGQPLEGAPTSALLIPSASEDKPIQARYLGRAPAVDPQMQSRGYLFLVEPNESQLAPGAQVSALLELAGEPQSGASLPRPSIIRFNGAAWVYLQTSETSFERVEVKLEFPLAEGWFVPAGFGAAGKVVIAGAQQLLSEELKSQGE